MTDLRTAAQQALGALKSVQDHKPNDETNAAITALRAALEQPEQCSCGDRLKDQCPGEWEPGCDLGNNQKYARRVALEQPKQPPTDPRVVVLPNPDDTWTPCFPMLPYPRGCRVCGMGADGQPVGYVCPRSDCPSRVSCGGAA